MCPCEQDACRCRVQREHREGLAGWAVEVHSLLAQRASFHSETPYWLVHGHL